MLLCQRIYLHAHVTAACRDRRSGSREIGLAPRGQEDQHCGRLFSSALEAELRAVQSLRRERWYLIAWPVQRSPLSANTSVCTVLAGSGADRRAACGLESSLEPVVCQMPNILNAPV